MGPRGDAILYTPALCCAAESAESRQKHLRISWQVYSVICGPRWDTVHTVRPCKHAVHDRPVRGRARHVAATRRAVASCCLSVSVCDPWTEERIERAKAVIELYCAHAALTRSSPQLFRASSGVWTRGVDFTAREYPSGDRCHPGVHSPTHATRPLQWI